MKLSGPTDRKGVQLQNVAVIVAARNESAHLRVCIEALVKACGNEAEIIVVDDGSTDDSETVLSSFGTKIRVFQGEGKGPGHARNLGMRQTQRPWIAFTDADCEVREEWLSRLCQTVGGEHASSTTVSVGGKQLVSKRAEITERSVGQFLESIGFISDYLHNDHEVREVNHNASCNVLYSKNALDEVDGFDESLWPCEDLELDLRLKAKGYTMLYDPTAIVEHRRPPTWKGLFQMMQRYGFAHAQLVKKHCFSQPIHLLTLLFPLGTGLIVWSLFWEPAILWVVIPGSICMTALLLWSKTRSLPKAFLFTAVLGLSILVWLLGFYAGLWGKRRIATAHE